MGKSKDAGDERKRQDNPGIVWFDFQNLMLRWPNVRADYHGREEMRATLDGARALYELFVRGDYAAVTKLAKAATKSANAARRNRELGTEHRERMRLRADVKQMLAEYESSRGTPRERDLEAVSQMISSRIGQWRALNITLPLAERKAKDRIGRMTTPEDETNAFRAARKCVEESVDAQHAIARVLQAYGLPRDHARKVAGLRSAKAVRAQRVGQINRK